MLRKGTKASSDSLGGDVPEALLLPVCVPALTYINEKSVLLVIQCYIRTFSSVHADRRTTIALA